MSRKNVEAIYPLSPMQQGMLFHSLLEPGSGVLVQQASFRIEGALDRVLLRSAWEKVVARHPVLRTSFLWEGRETPLQVVRERVELPWEDLDWRDLPAGRQEAELALLLERDARRGFELMRAPLVRVALIALAPEAHQLVFTYHHIVLDGWSTALLQGEVLACFEALRRGREPRLERSRPYRDYIAWLAAQDLTAAEALWRERLAGFTEPTPPPVTPSVPAPEDADERRGESETLLPAGLSADLQAFARRHRLTLSTLFQGAWALLLSRHGGGRDVVFGTTVSGRPPSLDGCESMIGLFINTLPQRVRIDSAQELADWLREIQAAQGRMSDVEHTPLVQAQRWSEVPPGRPLFESLLVFESYPVSRVAEAAPEDGSGLRIRGASAIDRPSYPLAAVVAPGPRIGLKIYFDRRRFAAPAVDGILARLAALLESLAGSAGQPVGSLRTLTAAEREQALLKWNRTAVPYPREATIPGLFAEQAALHPGLPALSWAGGALTYAGLDAASARLARRLRCAGAGPEVPVAVLLERSPELVVTLLAVLRAGSFFVPLDPAYPRERLASLLAALGARLVATREEWRPRLPEGMTVVCLDRDGGPEEETAEPVSVPAADSLAYVMFTSGSTGEPKGVAVSHRNVVRLVRGGDWAAMGPGEVYLQMAPASFDASTLEIWGPLLNGGELAVLPPEPPSLEDLSATLRRHRVTALWLTAGLFHSVVEHGLSALAPLRRLLAGGDVLSPDAVRRALAAHPDLTIVNGYGPTEGTTFTCCWEMRDPREVGETVPIGRPIANTLAYVLDEDLEPVPPGVWGELFAGGDGLGRGYFGRPDLTAERFLPDPFSGLRGEAGARLYRTGDRVRHREDGSLEFLGRVDRQLKIRGFRIEPAEIEAALARHPALGAAAVLARREETGETRLVAWVTALPGEPEEPAAVRSWLAERLPDFLVPAVIAFLPEMPLTANGKVDRRDLERRPLPAGFQGDTASFVAPRNPREETLAGVWREVLKVERVGVHDDFFALGGDSILCIQIAARLHPLGMRVTPAELFEHPTVAELAAVIEGGPEEEAPASPAAPVAGASRFPLVKLDETALARLLDGGEAVEDVYPLAPIQEGMLFHTLVAPGSGVFVSQSSWRLAGELDLPAFGEAWRRVVARHPILRTGFAWETFDQPLQVVRQRVEIPVRHHDLSGLDPAEQRRRLAGHRQGERDLGFELGRPPLMRLATFRLAADLFEVVWTYHHLILDGWSVPLVLQELLALYEGLRKGEPVELGTPYPYRDYIAWLQRQDVAGTEAFWRRLLDGAAVPTPLGIDHPAAGEAATGAESQLVLTAERTAALQAAAREHRLTLNTLVQGAWALLLGRYSGRDDVVFGATVSGRPVDLEGSGAMVGLFIGTVPVRARIQADEPLLSCLRALQMQQVEARQFEHTPLTRIQEWARLPRGVPLFESILVFENLPGEDVAPRAGSGFAVREASSTGQSNYPLVIEVQPGRELILQVRYDPSRFDEPAIVRLLDHLAALLAEMAVDLERPVGAIDLAAGEELTELMSSFNEDLELA